MNRVIRLLVALVVVLAACGGGEDGDAATTTLVAGGDPSTTTTSTTTTTAAPVDPGSGSSTDFCEFAREYAENVDVSPLGLSPTVFEERFRANLAAIEEAERIAPSEISDDVGLFADAFGGFIELLDEYDFNFLALDDDALEDPRLTALEDPALVAAGERIEAFCGFDDGEFIARPPIDPGGGSGQPGAIPGASLPDDFPAGLVPPGGEVVAAVDLAGIGTSVTFDVDSPVDDVIAFYEDAIGPAIAELPEPRGALWTGSYEGAMINVVVSETGPGVTQVIVTLG